MNHNWITYRNGNYLVRFNTETGTKIRETEEDEFIPSFSECCDVKLTDKCDGGCLFCYEGCTANGKHARIDYKFLNHLHPYTELAINGNDLSHPELIPFLEKLKEQHIITNMTVNQIHFERHQDLIRKLIDEKLIYGLGISLKHPTDTFIEIVKQYPNAVIHVINGVLTSKDVEALQDNNLKLLILGYKQLRRGADYFNNNKTEIEENQKWLYENLEKMVNCFNVISFDNMAIEQLNVRRLLSEEEWNEFFMGYDSEFTFYIDLVDGTFGKNSLATERFPIMDSIDDMFNMIRLK